MMRQQALACLGAAVALGWLCAGPAAGGGVDASIAGPTRGISLHLAYYPATPRSAAMATSTTALRGVDSHNPAALGFVGGYDLAFDFGRGSFNHGPDLNFYRGHVVFPMPCLGGYMKFMGMGLSTRHEDDTSRLGLDFHLWGREFGFAYGREIPLPEAIPGRLALGAGGFPFDPSEVRVSTPAGVKLAKARGESKLGSLRAGVLYEPWEFLAFGAEYSHINDRLRVSSPVPGFVVDRSDRYDIHLGTIGVAIRPDDKTVITLQHLFGRARGDTVYLNADNEQTFDYFTAGVERRVPVTEEFVLALRGGVDRGGLTCGLGCTLPHGFRVDYAFMKEYGYDLRNEFGTGPLHIIGIGKEF